MSEATDTQMQQWIRDIAGAEVTFGRFARFSSRATWQADGRLHTLTIGESLRNLAETAFKARVIALMAEGQHSYYTQAAG